MPRLAHAPGARSLLGRWLAERVSADGERVVFVTGKESLRRKGHEGPLLDAMRATGAEVEAFAVDGEPSDHWVDEARDRLRGGTSPAFVVAVGGGSVLDAGKALAAMLMEEGPTVHHLEGVGHRKPSGRSLPWIALPTTAGTGSEATHNAVLGRVGENGFKKSLRHPAFKAHAVILDAELALGCPRETTAACGMDALAQLIESYLSPRTPPLLDRWLEWGLELAFRSLPFLLFDGEKRSEVDCRHDLAMAAFLSGVGLAHSGLGTVHGFAGPLGARLPVPHGVVCGTLLAPCMRETVAWLEARDANSAPLDKVARIGRILADTRGTRRSGATGQSSRRVFTETLTRWTDRMAFPPLRRFGLTGALIEDVLPAVSNRNNPAELPPDTLRAILAERL